MSDFNSSMPVRTENPGDLAVKVTDGTITSQQLSVDSSGRVTAKMDDGSGNALSSQASGSQRALDVGINVAGVQVDPRAIRALTSADVVTANQGTKGLLANAWPMQPTDGTNSQGYTAAGEAKVSITQPLPAGTNLLGSVEIQDSAGGSITLGQKAMAASLPVAIASDQSAFPVKLEDGAGNALTSQANGAQRALDVGVNVGGVQVDPRSIRALTSADVVQANIKDGSGAAFSALNPLPVAVVSTVAGSEVNDYNTASSLAAGASSNHDYAITATKTFKGRLFYASASGKLKIEVQISADGSTFFTKWVGFNSSANPNISIELDNLSVSESGSGSKIRIIRTNLDKAAEDVYSTISGTEI